MRRFRLALLSTLLVFGVLGCVVAANEVWQSISHASEKLSLAGVGNFGRVNGRLYRGAQPTSEGFASLKGLGVDTVVRLSLGEEGSAAERAQVEKLGMRFVNLPWSSVHEPAADQVATFLSLLRDHPDRKVFVHCKAGSDRTGVMVALSRIAIDHWTPSEAIDEMKAFHYRYVFLPHLQTYVETFPARLVSEPGLAGASMID
jgi:protein tyrosine/serine phosphatase